MSLVDLSLSPSLLHPKRTLLTLSFLFFVLLSVQSLCFVCLSLCIPYPWVQLLSLSQSEQIDPLSLFIIHWQHSFALISFFFLFLGLPSSPSFCLRTFVIIVTNKEIVIHEEQKRQRRLLLSSPFTSSLLPSFIFALHLFRFLGSQALFLHVNSRHSRGDI